MKTEARSYPKRLIEVDLPIRRISEHARREKSIRHGHISTLHIWWARRPLAACRAVICASLWPDPADPECPAEFIEVAKKEMLEWTDHERLQLLSPDSQPRFNEARKKQTVFDDPFELRKALLDFIADFANWDNSTNSDFLLTSQTLTQAAHLSLGGTQGSRPLVLDPFAGGGSIPIEALRIGADSFASDLNPIPVLLNKVMLEYVPTYGAQLAQEVRKWGDWIKTEAQREIGHVYPKDPDGGMPISYLWARTIKCEGPGCGAEIPLVRSAIIAKKGSRISALSIRSEDPDRVAISVQENASLSTDESGTVRRSSATCPCCGYTTNAENVRLQFRDRKGGANDARMLAVITTSESKSGRSYRSVTARDLDAVTQAEHLLRAKEKESPDHFPSEALPYLRSIFNIKLLGVDKWRDLFSMRQLLSITTLNAKVREVYRSVSATHDPEFATALATCLALVVGKQIDKLSSLARWDITRENAQGTFGRQALGIVWDFNEVNPFSGSGGDWDTAVDWVALVLEREVKALTNSGQAQKASASEHPLPNDSVAVFVTDPPYYDAIPYADLSDFFYVWMKRSIKDLHPELFQELLSPKKEEVVQLAERNKEYAYKTKERFESLMRKALEEGRRTTMPSGLGVIVFAHKETAAWEVMLQALIDAGWVVTASWPIDTEMGSRMRALNSAVLASSVHLVCRPRENTDGSLQTMQTGDWRDVLRELPIRIRHWMPRLAEEGVVGADAIFACLGPALEVFSRYARVEKASGELVTLNEYLEHVWAAVSKEALSVIFDGASTEGFEPDARLTAMWLWTLVGSSPSSGHDANQGGEDDDDKATKRNKKAAGFALEYDAARKIAQGLGAHLEDLRHLIELSGDTARLLPVSERTAHLFGKHQTADQLKGRKTKKKDQQLDLFAELAKEEATEEAWAEKTVAKLGETTLDRVHQSMILFAANRGEALKRFLVEDGAGKDPKFWRLAQALSALYPSQTDEKRWVDGVLARKKGLGL
jgi:putative DNA methylase